MIASIKSKGFKYISNDDLVDNQFTLVSKSIQESEYTSISSIRYSEVQTFNLFKKNVDYNFLGLTSGLKAIRSISRGAKELMIDNIEVNIEKQENGLLATMIIKISEV